MIPWSPALKRKAEELLADVKDPVGFQQAVAREALNRLTKVTEGLKKFSHEDYKHGQMNIPVLWEQGSTRLFDYGGRKNSPIVFFVPSLINRAYILDLSEKSSMIKFLKEQGIRCLLLDWGDPGESEKHFTMGDYIKRISEAVEVVGEKVTLAGYCMGGLMALAEAQRKPENINGLALLATPWDFHSKDVERPPLNEGTINLFSHLWDGIEKVSGQAVYQLFYLSNPWVVNDKYARFAGLEPGSEKAAAFIERECWLNDGVALTTEVAKECFLNWAIYNTPMKGQWQVFGETIDPSSINIPTLIAIPKADKIVPPLSASPLSVLIPNAETIYSPSGHIGMIVGKTARDSLWAPLADWLKKL